MARHDIDGERADHHLVHAGLAAHPTEFFGTWVNELTLPQLLYSVKQTLAVGLVDLAGVGDGGWRGRRT